MKNIGWNGWKFDPEMRLIYHPRSGYEIDIEDCKSSAKVLDWIVQVSNKSWASDDMVSGLIRIFDSLLHLQANYCPGGVETKTKDNLPYQDISKPTTARVLKLV